MPAGLPGSARPSTVSSAAGLPSPAGAGRGPLCAAGAGVWLCPMAHLLPGWEGGCSADSVHAGRAGSLIHVVPCVRSVSLSCSEPW